MLLPLFLLPSHYRVPGNVPHAPPQRPPRAVANLWDSVTNQSTPSQAKHTHTLLWHTPAGSPDITATYHILTSSNTRLRGPGIPWQPLLSLGVQAKHQSGAQALFLLGVGCRNIQDVLHRGEAISVLRCSQGCLHLQVQPPSLLSFPIPSSHLWRMCCLNQPRSHVTLPFSLGIKGALLGILKSAKIKHHGTIANLKNNPYQALEQAPEMMELC